MNYRGVSSLLVINDGNKLMGIITEKDIVSRVVAGDINPNTTKIHEIMSQPVITVRPAQSLESAVKVMLMQGIKKLPVLGGDVGEDIVGILSLTDIAMLYPSLFTYTKMLQENQMLSVEKDVDFYIC
jgi:CBS domain-containing protein